MFAFGETVTFLHPGTSQDEYHNPVQDWSAPIRTVVEHVGVEPRPAGEQFMDGRNATFSGFTLYLRSGLVMVVDSYTDIYTDVYGLGVPVVCPLDRVEVRGVTLEVDGDVADWRNPFTGWAPGSVVQTKKVSG